MNKFKKIFVVFLTVGSVGLLQATCSSLTLKCGEGDKVFTLKCLPSNKIKTKRGYHICVPDFLEGATLLTFEKNFDAKIKKLCGESNPLLDRATFMDQYHQNKCDAKVWITYFTQVG